MTSPFAEVIGDPIEQSRSPLIHGFWLEQLAIEGDYRRARVTREELSAFITTRRGDPQWRGCNVTMPLKLEALLLADRASDFAVQAGACNLLIPRDGELVADNTDVGAVASVVRRLTAGRTPDSVTLLGTGGAARAVLVALTGLGLRDIEIHARNRDEARGLTGLFDLRHPPQPIDAQVRTEGLINATPLGMAGTPLLDLDLSQMPEQGWIFDLISSPAQTALVSAGERRGLKAEGGLAMLVEQAAASFPALFGTAPPRSPAQDALLYGRLGA